MIIRIADYNDLHTIDVIYDEAVAMRFKTADTEPLSWTQRIQWFELHKPDKYPVFVAEKENKVVGWISISPYRTGRKALQITAEISYYVSSAYHRQGIASALITHAIDSASLFGFKNIFAIVIDQNIESITLLQKFNFQQWGHLPDIALFEDQTCGQVYYGINLK